jgi:putative Ca2+/H+ antiporter (TMEM165/GDT1 family)
MQLKKAAFFTAALSSAPFDGAVFGRSVVRGLLGELGDKTFFLLLVLAAWCPWDGVRGGSWEYLQLTFVLLGGFVGLAVHICLVAALPDSAMQGWVTPSPFGWVPEAATGVLTLILALRAWLTCPPAPTEPVTKEGAEASKDDAAETETPWNQNAFLFNSPLPPPPEQSSRNARLIQDNKGSDGVFSERVSDGMVSTVIAAVGTLILMLLAESGDKAEAVMIAAGRRGADTAFGAVLGMLPAAFIAVLCGFILENQLAVRQVHIVVTFVLLSLSLVSFSECILALDALGPLPRPGIPHRPEPGDVFGHP